MENPDFYVVLHGHDMNFTHGFGPFASIEAAEEMINGETADDCDKVILPIRAIVPLMVISLSEMLAEMEQSLDQAEAETPPAAPRDPRKDLMN